MFVTRKKSWSRQDKVCAKARAEVSCEPGVLVSAAGFEAVGGRSRGVLSAPGCPQCWDMSYRQRAAFQAFRFLGRRGRVVSENNCQT